MVTAAYPDSQAEAITYPACGGQAECGGIDYDSSATQGTAAVVTAVTDLNSRCPDTKIVLIGYSQVCFPFRQMGERERGEKRAKLTKSPRVAK